MFSWLDVLSVNDEIRIWTAERERQLYKMSGKKMLMVGILLAVVSLFSRQASPFY